MAVIWSHTQYLWSISAESWADSSVDFFQRHPGPIIELGSMANGTTSALLSQKIHEMILYILISEDGVYGKLKYKVPTLTKSI